MKKLFVFMAAAAFVATSCADINVVEKQEAGEIAFQVVAANQTKANEIVGTALPDASTIYIAATHRNEDGEIVDGNYFEHVASGTVYNVHSTAAFWLKSAGTTASLYYGTAAKSKYYPLNGKLDFLAAVSSNETNSLLADAKFTNVDDSAEKLETGVIVTDAQDDFCWAISNGNSFGYGPVTLTFNHAQALLLFNVKYSHANYTAAKTAWDAIYADQATWEAATSYTGSDAAADYAAALVQNPAPEVPTYMIIDDIGFWTEEAVKAKKADVVSAASLNADANAGEEIVATAADDMTIKNQGEFFVDNSRIAPVVEWKNLASVTGTLYGSMRAVPAAATPAASQANKFTENTVSYDLTNPADGLYQAYGVDHVYNDTTKDKYFQLGETILVPQQDMQNFVLFYHFEGEPAYTHYTVLNLPRGNWKMGYKYFYNITVPESGPITFTVVVEDWKTGTPETFPLSF